MIESFSKQQRVLIAAVILCLAQACQKNIPVGSTYVPGETPPTTFTGSAGIDATPAAQLRATIVRPNGRASYLPDENITFEADCTDGAGRLVVPESVSWTSSLQTNAPLGTSNPLTTTLATLGVHEVTFNAKANGLSVSAIVPVEIVDPAKFLAVRFRDPDIQDVIVLSQSGAVIPFSLSIAGTPQPQLQGLTLTFRTSTGETLAVLGQNSPQADRIEGTLSLGTTPPTAPEGVYELIVEICEPAAAPATGCTRTGSARVTITVLNTNGDPVVAITDPAQDVTSIATSSSLALTGTITDPDANRAVLPDVDLVGTWTDSIVGKLGNGTSATLPSSATSVTGKHVIQLCATDHAGATRCDSRTVYVTENGAPLFSATGASLTAARANAIYIDAAGNTWIVTDQEIVMIAANGAVTSVQQLSGSGETAQQFNDVVISGSFAFFATDNGLWRCAVDSGPALSNCARLAGGASATDYPPDAETNTLLLSGSTLLAAGAEGIAYVADTSAGTAEIAVFYDRDGRFAPDSSIDDIAAVGSATWLALGDADFGVRGLCIISAGTNGLDGSPSEADCATAPAALEAALDGEATVVASSMENGHVIAYVGTTEGLVRFDTTTQSAVRYTRDEGLSGDHVTALVIRDGIAWVGTTNGLSRLDPATGLITRFDKDDFVGASTNEVGGLAILGADLLVNMGGQVFRYSGH